MRLNDFFSRTPYKGYSTEKMTQILKQAKVVSRGCLVARIGEKVEILNCVSSYYTNKSNTFKEDVTELHCKCVKKALHIESDGCKACHEECLAKRQNKEDFLFFK